MISHGQPCALRITACLDEPDVGTLPHTEVYSDDDETYFSDEESGNSGNENGNYDSCVHESMTKLVHLTFHRS